MNCISMPSLEHMTNVKIAIILWSQDDIGTFMQRMKSPTDKNERLKQWQEIENKVTEKIPKLLLPKKLEDKIQNLIKPIGLQVLEWMQYHVGYEYFNVRIALRNLCWTSRGTVDKKKSAEVSVRDESIFITSRYELACLYCLENDILLLWKAMPGEWKRSFCCKNRRNHRPLINFWTYYIKGEVAKLYHLQRNQSQYWYAFQLAVYSGIRVAVEYFLPKLTHRERKEHLHKLAVFSASLGYRSAADFNIDNLSWLRYNDVFFFLFSQMNEKEQIKVFRDRATVLNCLLEWPLQDSFMETAKRVSNFLSKHLYYELLSYIICDKVMMGFRDYDYQSLFGMFWKDTHKKYVIGKCVSTGSLLSKLFQANSEENIMFIFKNASVANRKKIIFSNSGKDICEGLIYNDNWDLLQFFVEKCIPSKRTMIKFKEEFKERITCRLSRKTQKKEKNMWFKFFQLLDNLFQNKKKRSIEDGDSSQAKKFCCTKLK